jgi:hypothetical protein
VGSLKFRVILRSYGEAKPSHCTVKTLTVYSTRSPVPQVNVPMTVSGKKSWQKTYDVPASGRKPALPMVEYEEGRTQ